MSISPGISRMSLTQGPDALMSRLRHLLTPNFNVPYGVKKVLKHISRHPPVQIGPLTLNFSTSQSPLRCELFNILEIESHQVVRLHKIHPFKINPKQLISTEWLVAMIESDRQKINDNFCFQHRRNGEDCVSQLERA